MEVCLFAHGQFLFPYISLSSFFFYCGSLYNLTSTEFIHYSFLSTTPVGLTFEIYIYILICDCKINFFCISILNANASRISSTVSSWKEVEFYHFLNHLEKISHLICR